jgi:hypothetical protein
MPHEKRQSRRTLSSDLIKESEYLSPITSWEDMFIEMKTTGVDFDAFWDESIEEGVAYFFRWVGSPRATVLVVWDDEQPTHIECRTYWDKLLSEAEAQPILMEVTRLFHEAGYWRNVTQH